MHYIIYNYKKLFRMFEYTEIFAWNCVQKYCERLSRRIEIYEARRAGLSVNWQLEIVALYQKCASRHCEREGDWHLCKREKKNGNGNMKVKRGEESDSGVLPWPVAPCANVAFRLRWPKISRSSSYFRRVDSIESLWWVAKMSTLTGIIIERVDR